MRKTARPTFVYGITCLFLLSIGNLFAQKDLFFNELTSQNGLEDTKIVFVYKDSRGYSWIGTLGNLYRFDGSEVLTYGATKGITEPYLQSSMFEDKSGNLWFCSYNKLFCYDRMRDTCLSFGGFQEKNGVETLGDYGLIHLEQQQNQLWLTAGGKIFRLDLAQTLNSQKLSYQLFQSNAAKIEGKRFLPLLDAHGSFNGFIEYFLIGAGMRIWVKESSHTLRCKEFFTDQPNKVSNLPPLKVKQVLKNGQSDEDFYLCTTEKIWKFNASLEQLTPLFTLPDNTRLYFAIHVQPEVLLCSTSEGLHYLHLGNKRFYSANDQAHQLSSNTISKKNISQLVSDRDGIIWGIAYDEGLLYTNPQVTKADFEPLNVNATCWQYINKNEYLLGTSTGLFLSNDTRSSSLLINEFVLYMYHDSSQQVIWVLTDKSIHQFNLRTRKLSKFIDDPTHAWAFWHSSDGMYWVGSHRDIKKLDLKTKQKTAINALTQKMLGCQGIWEDVQYQRLYLLEDATTLHILQYRNKNWELDTSFAVKGLIGAYLVPKGSDKVWVGTIQGIKLIHRTKGSFEDLPFPNSWPNTNITGMVQDKQGIVWVSTNTHILTFTARGKPLRMYTPQEGFFAGPFRAGSMQILPDHSIGLLGRFGINRFNPSIQNLDQPLPKIQLTRLSIQGNAYKKIFPQDTSIYEKKRIILKYRQNSVALRLVAIELGQPGSVKIQYYLNGLEKRAEASIRNQFAEARYGKLSPGKYKLMVRAANANGEWTPWQTKLTIEVIPPLWMRLWFIILEIIGGAIVVAFLVQLYYRRLLRDARIRNEEQERILRDIHDLTSGKVVFFQDFQQFAEKEIPGSEAKSQALGIADQALQLFKRISAAVRNNTESDSTLVEFLHQLITDSKKNVASKLHFTAQLDSSIPYAWVAGTYKKHLRLVVQEALGNVLKHAQASTVIFKVSVQEGKLFMQIQDDGKGMSKQQIAQIKPTERIQDAGNGLGNMLHRMQSIGGHIQWVNQQGTTVVVSISLQKIKPKPKSFLNFA